MGIMVLNQACPLYVASIRIIGHTINHQTKSSWSGGYYIIILGITWAFYKTIVILITAVAFSYSTFLICVGSCLITEQGEGRACREQYPLVSVLVALLKLCTCRAWRPVLENVEKSSTLIWLHAYAYTLPHYTICTVGLYHCARTVELVMLIVHCRRYPTIWAGGRHNAYDALLH